MMSARKIRIIPSGLAVGFLAGLLGAGGGMIAVPALRSLGLSEEKAHATSISVMLPLVLVSGMFYLNAGSFELSRALEFWPGGIAGAVVGAILLTKLKAIWIRRIFACVMLFFAIRLLTR
ncbi:MAG: sulfite exporter TauE/SafE family protein [Oscillospiraceae bacterium]|nr:sulfite exporter TauE/SafE family protein [Oscillospiraceae bacterium]